MYTETKPIRNGFSYDCGSCAFHQVQCSIQKNDARERALARLLMCMLSADIKRSLFWNAKAHKLLSVALVFALRTAIWARSKLCANQETQRSWQRKKQNFFLQQMEIFIYDVNSKYTHYIIDRYFPLCGGLHKSIAHKHYQTVNTRRVCIERSRKKENGRGKRTVFEYRHAITICLLDSHTFYSHRCHEWCTLHNFHHL